MEPRRSSKKPRSFGGASKGTRNSHNAHGTATATRPQYKERVNSAPLGNPRSEESQQPRRIQQTSPGRSGEHTRPSSTGSGLLSSPSSTTKQHVLPIQRQGGVSKTGGCGEVQEVALAVLGGPAVGKTTFVRCALELKKASISPISSKKVSLEGKISIVRLLEIGLQDVEVTTEQKVLWPEKVGDQKMPKIDGVLALYDVMDQSSIALIPPLLKALSKEAIPTVLVSAKCDNPFKTWEVNQNTVEGFCSSLQGLETFQTSASAPETHKRCISVILRNIMLDRRVREEKKSTGEEAPQDERPSRPRASTNTQLDAAFHSSFSSKIKSRHGRAASEIPISMPQNFGETVQISHSPSRSVGGTPRLVHLARRSSPSSRQSRSSTSQRSLGSRPSSDASDDEPAVIRQDQRQKDTGNSNNESDAPVRHHPSRLSDMPGTFANPSYDMREGLESTAAEFDFVDSSEAGIRGSGDEKSKELGVPFEELVDRLLSQPTSKSDVKFATIFLCLYRKFAAPSTLILAVIRRFEELNGTDCSHLTRMASQLRYLNVLKDWVSTYPGDFAQPLSRRIITGFMQSLTTSQEYAIASIEINPHLDVLSEDDDMDWACLDISRSRANTTESFLTMSSVRSTASTLNADSPTLTADSSTEDIVDHASTEKAPTPQPNRTSATLSLTSSISRSDSQSAGSSQTLPNSVEIAQRQARLLTPISRNMLTKAQWHQLMDIPEEQIAQELTRIDWIMYSSIKPRDLIRHVSLQADQKDKCRSLEHVNRVIHQFNHVAFWITNMILLRDKPKHRAKALEKFMGVAWKLRYLNNYNSLGAVIAGVNGIAVHRLKQTRELIPVEAQKQFMRLEILMGTQKSHFAYRLAFGNTSSSRIPFLPLHRRDLVLAEQGNRTYIDGGEGERINWKKFEIMGEVIVSIRKSQELGYPTIPRNEEVQGLVLDGRFCKDDDVLYERSLQVEAPGVGENTKKRFNWFQR